MLQIRNFWSYSPNNVHQVVSTILSGVLFARFPTVDYVSQSCSFLFITSSLFKKSSSRAREGVIIDHDVIVIFPLGRFY